jgi:hypothetical protein
MLRARGEGFPAAGELPRYLRSYEPGTWLPEPRLQPEPPASVPPADIVIPEVVPPELADYAALLR